MESLWQLEINKDYAGFDIHTLSDAVLHIRYTAREGGETLKDAAKAHLSEALKSTFTTLDGKPQPLTRLFSLRHEFPEAWNELTQPVPADVTGEVTRVLTLPITKDRFPFITLARKVMPTRVTVLIAPKPDAKVPDFKVTMKDKPLSDAGASMEPAAAIVDYRVWIAAGPFAQIAQVESAAWMLSLTLDAMLCNQSSRGLRNWWSRSNTRQASSLGEEMKTQRQRRSIVTLDRLQLPERRYYLNSLLSSRSK